MCNVFIHFCIFNLPSLNLSSCTLGLMLTQPVTEMRTRDFPWVLKVRGADDLATFVF